LNQILALFFEHDLFGQAAPTFPDHALSRGGLRHRDQMALEPVARQARHFVQCSRFVEQVRCPRHDHELLFAAQLRERCPIQFNDLAVIASDN
jgi:hypothetical protein